MYKPPDTGNGSYSPFGLNGGGGNNLSLQNGRYSSGTVTPASPYQASPPPYQAKSNDAPPWGNMAPHGGPPGKKPRFMTRAMRKYSSMSRKSKVLLLLLIFILLVPSISIIFEGINSYILYSQAIGGVHSLQDAAAQFSGGPVGSTSKYFNVAKLRVAQQDIQSAQNSFQQLSDELDTDGSIGLVGDMFPQQVTTTRALGHIGVDATKIANQVLSSMIMLSPTVEPVLQASEKQNNNGPLKPIINQQGMAEISADINYALPLVQDMSQQAKAVSVASLPLNASQQRTLNSALNLLPVAVFGLSQMHNNISEVSWILGVDSPRAFLIEPMDRAELRATGGFTGQFGELDVNGGHMSKLQLQNIGAYEENLTPPVNPAVFADVEGQPAPAPYNSWWPIANFGMRDANLSADLPTSAQIIMNQYDTEFTPAHPLDGFISFTPYLIEDILNVVGPVKIPQYGETITAQNLEDRLHYYQLDNTGIRKEEIIQHIENPQLARKAFTQLVMQQLQSTIEHSTPNKILDIIDMLGQAMKEKNLQIYVTNPQVEALIAKYGSTDSMDVSPNHDGVYMVQTNLSANKASQYVTTAIQDNVTLDNAGDATHQMQITLNYQEKGPVEGPDTYDDYVRVYVPTNSQYISGNGFDQVSGTVCGDIDDTSSDCAADVYGDGSLVCATAGTPIGPEQQFLSGLGPMGDVLDSIGGPTNTTSDQTGRAMFGGWVVIPKNCIMKVSLSWYVPAANNNLYSLMFQPQASVMPQVSLSISAPAGVCGSGSTNVHYASTSDGADEMFSLAKSASGCTLQRKE